MKYATIKYEKQVKKEVTKNGSNILNDNSVMQENKYKDQ